MSSSRPKSRRETARVARSRRASSLEADQVARIVRRCLNEGKQVEIDGLGVFRPDGDSGFQFLSRSDPKVFLAYVEEDGIAAERLFEELGAHGFDPWMDRRKLLPGQNWPRCIEHAIATCDFFIPCFSHNSVGKKGGFQAEIRYALDCARHLPLDEIFIIPARLDECCVPEAIRRHLQYIDLFPNWDPGLRRITSVIDRRRVAA